MSAHAYIDINFRRYIYKCVFLSYIFAEFVSIFLLKNVVAPYSIPPNMKNKRIWLIELASYGLLGRL